VAAETLTLIIQQGFMLPQGVKSGAKTREQVEMTPFHASFFVVGQDRRALLVFQPRVSQLHFESSSRSHCLLNSSASATNHHTTSRTMSSSRRPRKPIRIPRE
jgi:hypothetical protein